MQDYEKLGAFYLGRLHDTETGQTTSKPFLYDSADLVTHAVCVGMTGSGKTGLCIDLLEEAAIDGIPALVIDPKGDIPNLLLQFPALQPADFHPWINEDDARRQNLTPAEFAAQQAELWRSGLAKWDEAPERIARLAASADFAVYTPGSSAGLALSILSSFRAPADVGDRELVRDRVNATATAVLALLGIEGEPLKSRQHILLATVFDYAWREGKNLTMEDLIHSVQQPPVNRVGVLDLESFYPSGERFELSMALNNLLASPGFEAWLTGEPLDIGRLLYTPEGKPRVSILSVAHLSDAERMFFVTLVLNELLTWTRAQSGTTSLRAIFYMDEIFGYFPPVANPPSKKPLLTLLKQARAFGIGCVLATQNPVDLDYKGLANAGTWFIGRLQTERDKHRLLEGLESAAGDSGAKFDRARLESVLSSLGKRMFLMNNVHEDGPVVFETRWALSYLRGPLTRTQIRTLMGNKATAIPREQQEQAPVPRRADTVGTRPVLPPDIAQHYIPTRAAGAGLVYRPMLLGAAHIRFTDTKSKVDTARRAVFLTPITDAALPVNWTDAFEIELDPADLEKAPSEDAAFEAAPAPATRPRSYVGWSKDFVNWIYGSQALQLHCIPALKLSSAPGESEGDFRVHAGQMMREQRDAAIAKIRAKYASRLAVLQDRLRRSEQAVQKEREQARGQTLEAMVSVGTGVFGALFGRKKLATAAGSVLRSAGRAQRESSDINRAEENVEALQSQLESLQAQVEAEISELQSRFDPALLQVESLAIKPKKSNIQVQLVALTWAPYTKDSHGAMQPAW